MDETRAVARLPHLDVEIAHRRGDDEERVSIHLRAAPSFHGFADYLETSPLLWPWLAAAPWVAWQQAMRSAFAPWLAGGRAGLERGSEASSPAQEPDDNVHRFPGSAQRSE